MRKIFIIAAAIVAITTPALAQQEYTLKLSNDEVNKIGSTLAKLPFEEVAPLIQKLRQQIVEQQQAKPEATPAPTPGK